MEYGLACGICYSSYNQKNRKPLNLPCSHTYCRECIVDLNSKPTLVCPQDSESWPALQSVDDLKPNWVVMNYLSSIILLCHNHSSESADFLDRVLLYPYCQECSNNVPKANLLEVENDALSIGDWLSGEIKSFSNVSSLTQLMQNKIKNVRAIPNIDKLQFLRELRNFANRLCCSKHPDVQAPSVDLDTGDCMCIDCSNGKTNLVNLEDPEFSRILIKVIAAVIRYNEASDLPAELRRNPDELANLPKRELINLYKGFMTLKLNSIAILSNEKCMKCLNRYTLSSMPYILPCVGRHVICKTCVDMAGSVICPVDKCEYSKDTIIEIFNSNSPPAKCDECKLNFTLKTRLPKLFPCGYVACLECVERNYINNPPRPCKTCKIVHENPIALPNSDFFCDLLSTTTLYCSIHRNRIAERLIVSSYASLCDQCNSEIHDDKINLNEERVSVYNILCELFSQKQQADPNFKPNISIEDFSKLTNQKKLDKIRETLQPEKKDSLRSNIPSGKRVEESASIANSAFLYRFFSTMPSVEYDQNFIFVTKPWVIDSEKNQVEAVVFQCKSNIQLNGIGLGQALNNTETSIESLEIRIGRALSGNPIYTEKKQYKFDFTGDIQDIIFSNPVEIKKDTPYNIKIKIRGEMMRRGSPFDLKEAQIGSDGCLFMFSELESLGDDYVNGQHHINGPIIKLSYQRS